MKYVWLCAYVGVWNDDTDMKEMSWKEERNDSETCGVGQMVPDIRRLKNWKIVVCITEKKKLKIIH